MKIKLAIIVLNLVFVSRSTCQNIKKIDSLFTAIKNTNSDTVKIKTLNLLTKQYWSFKPDSALPLIKEACDLSEKVKEPKFITSSLIYLGYTYLKLSEFDSAQNIFLRTIKICSKNDLKKNQAYALNCLGDTYNLMGLYDKASARYIEAIKIQEAIGDKKGSSKTFNSLGTIFELQGNYEKAVDYYTKSLKIKIEFNDKDGQCNSYHNIAGCYESLTKYDTAIIYFQKATRLALAENNLPLLAMCYYSTGNCYAKLIDNNDALYYHKEALQIYSKLNDQVGLANANFSLANDYLITNNEDLGFIYLKKADQIAQEIEYKDLLVSIYADYHRYYSKKSDFKNAYFYSIKYITLNDSVYNASKSKEINELSTKYETEKKEQENKLLEAKNQLSTIAIKQQKIITYFFIAGLFIVSILAFFIFKGLKQQRSANKIISMQKQEVEEQKQKVEEHQKEIIDSINYASRIQKALLPNEKYINRKLEELIK